jgi:hypothetical protein
MPNSSQYLKQSIDNSKLRNVIVKSNIQNAAVKNQREANSLKKLHHKLDLDLKKFSDRMSKESHQITLNLVLNSNTENCKVDTNRNLYFSMMREQQFDQDNFFVPILFASIDDQERASMRSLKDMKAYWLGYAKKYGHKKSGSEPLV